ncbi:MAG: COX15/CtaA family protein [Phycisphaerales bacterium]
MAGARAFVRPAVFTVGFAASIALWGTWFLTHLPWLGMREQVSLPTIVVIWLSALTCGGYAIRKAGSTIGETTLSTTFAGLLSSLTGLLVLGSKLTTRQVPEGAEEATVTLVPAAGAILLGFLLTGAILGLIGGVLGGAMAQPRHRAWSQEETDAAWLGRFAIVAAAAVFPLIVVGGLVTSTNSGMAVPDWPNTYGTNMFLYPLGPRAAPSIFLEHSHRLFGSLIGLTAIALVVQVFLYSRNSFARKWAVAILLLVIVQGVLGGLRVNKGHTDLAQDTKFYRILHGMLAQGVFCMFVVLAVHLNAPFQHVREAARRGALEFAAHGVKPKLLRMLSTGALHATLLQILFGVMYRHTRSSHALWSHIGFSVVAVILVAAAGFAAARVRPADDRIQRVLFHTGAVAVLLVGVQFLLGWVALLVGGSMVEPKTPLEIVARTVHQANGALVLASVTVLYVWGRAVSPKNRLAPVA